MSPWNRFGRTLLTLTAGMMATVMVSESAVAQLASPVLRGRQDSETSFSVPLPGRRFYSSGGQVLFVTAIGPDAGSRVIGSHFDITWVSDGTTPASELEIYVGMAVEDGYVETSVTGEELGFGSGRGIHRGTVFTDELNGVVEAGGLFEHGLVDIHISRSDGGAMEGRGFFVQSSIDFTMIPAGAIPVVETFEDGVNDAGWTYGTGQEYLMDEGGNPGVFLYEPNLETFTPIASTTPGVSSEFTGNYTERGVMAVGVDLKTFNTSANPSARRLSLLLYNDNDTPDDYLDDWGAFVVGESTVPEVIAMPGAAGWKSFDFLVPSDAGRMPEGWVRFDEGNWSWADLMADVDGVEFYYGVPGEYQLLGTWTVGLDNPRLHTR